MIIFPEMGEIRFSSLEAVFDFINANIGRDKLLLVIDELPFWAEKDPALLSVMQKYIDTVWMDKNLKIILYEDKAITAALLPLWVPGGGRK